ncbi:MAG: Cell division protein FtsI/penicillin-binding protein 2 [Acidimicrobiales bacterium]|nr:Cell division protein FtsI/penicillin-binding protein 2 [Acidimicrobiales bacterium]
MDGQIRKLGLFLIICFLALFAQLNYIQVFRSKDLSHKPTNTRAVEASYSRQRGTITTADGVVIARSVPSKDRYKFQRVYPEKELFGHITGYFSYILGPRATGLEAQYNDELSGRTTKQRLRSVSDLFVKHDRTGRVTLTIRKDLQLVAKQQLAGRKGSVVALDPKTGAILALYSYPDFDPNALSSHPVVSGSQVDPAVKIKGLLDASKDKPLLARTYQDTFFPGSTFKVVTASTGVQTGTVRVDQPSYPVLTSYHPPATGTYQLRNFGGESCGGTLFQILAKSCNSAFAQMGVENIGGPNMVAGARAFGFDEKPPIDLPGAVASQFPLDFTRNNGKLAQASIGQNDVSATPLQMALVAATIANQGRTMQPHLLDVIRDGEAQLVTKNTPSVWKTPISPQTADVIKQAMLGVVANGTATGLQLAGFEVGGKTGTAELGTNPPLSHTWIIGFAGPAGDPKIAFAVIVERQPGISESTGGRVAAPIAKALIQAALNPPTNNQGGGG